jgi:hypothetical protein
MVDIDFLWMVALASFDLRFFPELKVYRTKRWVTVSPVVISETFSESTLTPAGFSSIRWQCYKPFISSSPILWQNKLECPWLEFSVLSNISVKLKGHYIIKPKGNWLNIIQLVTSVG